MKGKSFSFVVSFSAEFNCTFQPDNFDRLKNEKCWKSAEPKVLGRLTLSGTSGLLFTESWKDQCLKDDWMDLKNQAKLKDQNLDPRQCTEFLAQSRISQIWNDGLTVNSKFGDLIQPEPHHQRLFNVDDLMMCLHF